MAKKIVFGVLVLLALSSAAFAQSVGVLTGQVTDDTGGALPGATVQVTNEDTGIAQTVTTDGEGRYRSRNLSLGRYKVEATLSGFQTVVRTGIVLTIDREAVVDFKLAIGEISDAITVEGDAPLVEVRSSGQTSLVAREQLADLPLNARDYSQLIAIQPGTTYFRAQKGSEQSGYGARISVGGARVTSNVFALDGTDIQTSSGLLPSGVTGATLGLEAVQEFKILTSNYSAQYGRGTGATVLAATRSGTNALHGSGYWYHRDDSLDTRNFFDSDKKEFSRNQMGFAVGGPVMRDRTFFFGNYEILRDRSPLRANVLVPNAAARAGNLPAGTIAVNSAIVPYLNLWPLPNGRVFADGTGEFTRDDTTRVDQDYFSARVDHNFSPKHTVFVRYTRDESDVLQPQAIPLFETVRATQQQYLTAEYRSVLSSRFLNQIRGGYTRDLMDQGSNDVNAPPASLAFYTGRPFGTIIVNGMSTLEGPADPNKRIVSSGQIHDDATLDLGRHSIRFGGSVTRFEYTRNQLSRAGGEWTFGSLSAFLQNQTPTRLRIMGFNAIESATFNQNLLAAYFQDDLRLGSRLTLNAGVRFEYLTVPTEKEGRIANVPGIFDTLPRVGDPLYENPGGFVAPRLGLAWDVRGNGRTSVRANVGAFHEPLLVKYYLNSLARVPPYWKEADPGAADRVGIFPNLNPHLDRLSQGSQAIHTFDGYPSNPFAVQWSVGVQQMLGANLVADVAYTGSIGRNLGGRRDFAIPGREVVNGVTFYPASATQIINPGFARMEWYDTSAHSEYHAMKLNIAKRYSNGLHFQAAYTWSDAKDTLSAVLSGELASATYMDSWDPERDWGLADFHVRHVFSGNFGYELPWGKDATGVAAHLVQGWQVGGIVTLTSGSPFSAGSNPQLTHPLVRGGAARPDLIPGGDDNPVLGGIDAYFDVNQFVRQQAGFYGTVGRNTMEGPGLASVDASLIKNFAAGGSRKAQFRAEVFNLLNRANFALPATTLFNASGQRVATAGRITSTVTSSRQIQLALRFEF